MARSLREEPRSSYDSPFWDDSSCVELPRVQQEAAEFYSSIYLSRFGVMFIGPDSGGGVDQKDADVLSSKRTHSSTAAMAMLKCGLWNWGKRKIYREHRSGNVKLLG